jgi:hypothetical protein
MTIENARAELEGGLAELRKWKPRDWPLERAIRAALENLGNREVVQRALDALDKSLRKAKPWGNA